MLRSLVGSEMCIRDSSNSDIAHKPWVGVVERDAELAADLAVGRINPRSLVRVSEDEMQPLVRVIRPGAVFPQCIPLELLPDMCKMPPLPWSLADRKAVTQQKIRAFFLSRNMQIGTTEQSEYVSIEKRRDAVATVLKQEAKKIAAGERIRVRDPYHRSLLEMYADAGWNVPEDVSDYYTDIPESPVPWVTGLKQISAISPRLDQETMKEHLADRLINPDGKGKVWLSGYQRIVNRVTLPHLAVVVDEGAELAHARSLVPASMLAESYMVRVVFETHQPAGSALEATRVRKACCTCVNGKSAKCSHVSALFWILHGLNRPPGHAIPTPEIAERMLWNQPNASAIAVVTEPLCYMNMTHADPEMLHKDFRALHSTKNKRGRYAVSYTHLTLPTKRIV
eukprot:TRINITY_DN49270_c0_g1_i1.p1 TRINITY_DN49270_c0_g1~~TRINITY_DN49270_c0_g1_i1.p1  ORF type:complete len:396 (+),score=32.57 TRINITY_DN49270_c0_g1_i1:95-1282(+)